MYIHSATNSPSVATDTNPNLSMQTLQNNSANQVDTSVSISTTGKNAADAWQQVADAYDVENITHKEIVSMSEKLNEAGLMPDGVMLAMIAPTSMNMDRNQKIDFLQSTKNGLAHAENSGMHRTQIELKEKVLSILEHLKSLR